LGRRESRGSVNGCRELYFSAVLGGGAEMWCVFGRNGLDMVETEECCGHIVGHADVDGAVGVVPLQMQSNVEFAGPINGDGVFALEYLNEIF
jgi:hypothetical protein